MDLVKYFYLLHFCHSLLPFYIAPCTGCEKTAAQCFVQRLFPNNNNIFLFQPDLLGVFFQQLPLKEGGS